MTSKRLTVGMRAKFTAESHWVKENWFSIKAGAEVLIKERSSSAGFSVMLLGQKELKKKDPQTVLSKYAWVSEEDLEFVDADFDTNLEFIDWYSEHEDDFCGDCGAWFPENGSMGEEAGAEPYCPNKECPGNLYNSGICPGCKTPEPEEGTVCPKCGFNWNSANWNS